MDSEMEEPIGACTIPEEGHQRPSRKYLNRHVMKPVGSKWYNLGIDLLEEDDIETLNTIRSQHPTDFNICCAEMFQLWLSKQPTASWNQLIESLRQPGVDLCVLATRIKQMLLQPNVATGQPKPCSVRVEPQSTLISVTSLNADFSALLLKVCQILSNCPNQHDNLETCKDYCLLLRISDSSSESLFSAEKTAKIKDCSNFKQLFEIVSFHMSWDEHSILTQIVDQCNSVEGQQEIEKFEKKMALYQGLQIISSTSQPNLSEDFARFCIIINKPYKSVTVEEYTKVKAYIFSNLKTHAYVTVGFIRMLYHSLHIQWVVTTQAVPHMIKNAHQNKNVFIQENYIFMQIGIEVVIDDEKKGISHTDVDDTRSCEITQSTRSTSFNPEDSQSLKWLQHNVETAVEVKEKKIISSKDVVAGDSKPTLKELCEKVTPYYAAHWMRIGIFLKIHSGALKIIETDYLGDCQKCCDSMLAKWLEVDDTATWEKLIHSINLATSVLHPTCIVYSKDDDPSNHVCDLSDFLNRCGVNCDIDQYHTNENIVDWESWIETMIKSCASRNGYVLIVCSLKLYQKLSNPASISKIEMKAGHISNLTLNALIKDKSIRYHIIPIFLEQYRKEYIATCLAGISWYSVHITKLLELLRQGGNIDVMLNTPGLEPLQSLVYRLRGEQAVKPPIHMIPSPTPPMSPGTVTFSPAISPFVSSPAQQQLSQSTKSPTIYVVQSAQSLIKTPRTEVVDEVLQRVADNIGRDWSRLGVRLGIGFRTLEQIRRSAPYDIRQQAYLMLVQWKETHKTVATMTELQDKLDALKLGHIGRL